MVATLLHKQFANTLQQQLSILLDDNELVCIADRSQDLVQVGNPIFCPDLFGYFGGKAGDSDHLPFIISQGGLGRQEDALFIVNDQTVYAAEEFAGLQYTGVIGAQLLSHLLWKEISVRMPGYLLQRAVQEPGECGIGEGVATVNVLDRDDRLGRL